MAAFETTGGGSKGYCLLYRCFVILMPPESAISYHHSRQDLRKKMKETPRKQSIVLKLKLKQSFWIVTRLAESDMCVQVSLVARILWR